MGAPHVSSTRPAHMALLRWAIAVHSVACGRDDTKKLLKMAKAGVVSRYHVPCVYLGSNLSVLWFLQEGLGHSFAAVMRCGPKELLDGANHCGESCWARRWEAEHCSTSAAVMLRSGSGVTGRTGMERNDQYLRVRETILPS